MAKERELYERLGGREAIGVVVDQFYERVLDDERLEQYFLDTNMRRLRNHQTQFLVAALGGPDEYAGESVREAHEHLDISSEDFDIVAGHLQATLEEFDVDDEAIEEVMVTVGGLRDQVIGH